MFPMEGDRWIVSMGGWAGDHCPTDEAGFLAYARTLPAPEIAAVVAAAEPVFPQTRGPKPAGIDVLNRYVAMMHRATLSDPEVTRAFLRVMNLLAPPASLMAPRIMWRVLATAWDRRRGRRRAPTPSAA